MVARDRAKKELEVSRGRSGKFSNFPVLKNGQDFARLGGGGGVSSVKLWKQKERIWVGEWQVSVSEAKKHRREVLDPGLEKEVWSNPEGLGLTGERVQT